MAGFAEFVAALPPMNYFRARVPPSTAKARDCIRRRSCRTSPCLLFTTRSSIPSCGLYLIGCANASEITSSLSSPGSNVHARPRKRRPVQIAKSASARNPPPSGKIKFQMFHSEGWLHPVTQQPLVPQLHGRQGLAHSTWPFRDPEKRTEK